MVGWFHGENRIFNIGESAGSALCRIFAIGGMMGGGEAFGAESSQKVQNICPNASLQISRSAA
jgi:hypothetical protein